MSKENHFQAETEKKKLGKQAKKRAKIRRFDISDLEESLLWEHPAHSVFGPMPCASIPSERATMMPKRQHSNDAHKACFPSRPEGRAI